MTEPTESCLKTNSTGNCVCKLPEGHEGLCKCSSCGQEFQGEPSTDTQNREQKRSAERCVGCPLLLSGAEVSVVEKAIGKQAFWMFNKVWEERRNAVQFLGLAKKALKIWENKKVELEYWIFKEQEIKNIIKLQTAMLDPVIKKLKDKIDPDLYNKITAYVQREKKGLPL